MDKKDIQEKRMKGYFVEAAKNIIRGEGLAAFSVRNVAEEAGYSFTTLYNYFKDAKDLMYECMLEFLKESDEFVNNEIVNEKNLINIKSKSKAYMKYFIQYPGTFQLFFLEKFSGANTSLKMQEAVNNFYNQLVEEDWYRYGIEKNIDIENLTIKKELYKSMVHGLLLLYLNRRIPDSYLEFMSLFASQSEFILN